MQAFIKDNKLIVNSIGHNFDKPDLLNYIKQTKYKKIISEPLYDINGDISGISFKLE